VWCMLGLIACCIFLAGVSVWAFRRSRHSAKHLTPSNTRTLARFFHERVIHFKCQIQTLEEHSNEYTAVFSDNAWRELNAMIAHLEQLDVQIQGLLVTKQFSKAASMLRDLYDRNAHPLDTIQANIDTYRATSDWETHVRGMLKNVVRNLEAATNDVAEIKSPQRSRKRRPTLVTLADVKKRLLEDEVTSRELQ
jgi:hypothetical protein